MKSKTNKLNIYMIKESHNIAYMVENAPAPTVIIDDPQMELYKTSSFDREPKFMQNFFHDKDSSIRSATAQVLLIVKNVGAQKRILAIAFGTGRYLLNPDAIERRFGLKTALNLINPENTRRLSKVKLDANRRNEFIQASKNARISEFGIDIAQDLVRGVSGAVQSDQVIRFGKNVSGTDALNLRTECDITNVRKLSEYVVETYYKDAYKQSFGWIDQIQEIKERDRINELNDTMICNLKEQKDDKIKIWASIPDFMDDNNLDGFRIGKSSKRELVYDINKQMIINALGKRVDLQHLKNLHIFALSSASDSAPVGSWSAYRCIYAEIPRDDTLYMLLDGVWYAISNDFVGEIQREFDVNKIQDSNFIDYNHKDEAEYNKELAREINGVCCDAQPIPLAGYDKVELCDVLTPNNDFIHVKKYSRSSILSHLFNQGLVSGELIKNSVKFKEAAEKKFNKKIDISERNTVVFAIITKKPDRFDLPFFSKVSLVNVQNKLQGLGFTVKVVKIKDARE